MIPLSSPHPVLMASSDSPSPSLADLHNVSILGKGRKTVVLAHGFGGDQTVWATVLPYLVESNYRVLLYDLAGSGRCDPGCFSASRHSTLQGFADDLLRILDEVRQSPPFAKGVLGGGEKGGGGRAGCGGRAGGEEGGGGGGGGVDSSLEDIIYVGHSMSAMIGILAAVQRPRMFRRIISLMGSPRYLNDSAYVGGFDREDIDSTFQAMVDDYPAWAKMFAAMLLGPSASQYPEERKGREVPDGASPWGHASAAGEEGVEYQKAVEYVTAGLLSMRPEIAVAISKAIFASDYRSVLERVTCPVHLLVTENDFAVPQSVGPFTKDRLCNAPEVHLEVLPISGHLPHVIAPKSFAAVLLRHLQMDDVLSSRLPEAQ